MCSESSFEEKSTTGGWTTRNDDSRGGPQRCMLHGERAGAAPVQQVEPMADQVCGMAAQGFFSFRAHRVGLKGTVLQGCVPHLNGYVIGALQCGLDAQLSFGLGCGSAQSMPQGILNQGLQQKGRNGLARYPFIKWGK